MNKKIYKDPNTGFSYLFNQAKLIASYTRYISSHKISKRELNKTLSSFLHVSDESIRKHLSNKNSPSLIDLIFDYGDFLEGDRYSFLELRETEESLYEKAQGFLSQRDFTERCIQAVRSGVINILAEYAATNCFNQKHVIEPDIVIYYRKKVDALELLIMQINNEALLKSQLLDLTATVKKFICAGEYPGPIKEWYEVNPNLRFYSPAFTLMINYPEAFELAITEELLDYYPTEEDRIEYLEYFARLDEENQKQNYHYNINDYLQRELIYTVSLLFETQILK